MVSATKKMSLILFFASSLLIQGIIGMQIQMQLFHDLISNLKLNLIEFSDAGELICDNLPTNLCSFAIASSGKRCVLENYRNDDGSVEYTCKTSEVMVERMAGYIETDQCVKACGVDRGFVGISSDAFLTPDFTARLCSPSCYQNCPNIVDLYFNLAAGEGNLLFFFSKSI